MHPDDALKKRLPAEDRKPKQIDGVVFSLLTSGPAVIREGGLIAAHPAFCCGIIEIKTSENDPHSFSDRLC